MSTEALSTFLRIARSDAALLAELRAAADAEGLRVVALAAIAARHGHTIDPASLAVTPPRRNTGTQTLSDSSPPNPVRARFGDAQLFRDAAGELRVRL
ncbi:MULTISPECIES: Nif11 family protein [Niveibacterium]|uniref:Nif11 family protein n=1 Tax=Niveibacterium microcysteis TaxID=2811415 RepID=A0ABX7MAA6_9RHOO|nr:MULTISPECIES: Nif11 family protein [Niveibacterium]QSI78063.1 Nif11 family protein [Niveibacterium microcysteis]